MKYCSKCGSKLNDGDRFCEHCGAEAGQLSVSSAKQNSTDKKQKKKIIIIISVVSAIAVALAACAIIFVPKMLDDSGNNKVQTTAKTTWQVVTETSTTVEPTTVVPTTAEPTTAEPTTVQPTTEELTDPITEEPTFEEESDEYEFDVNGSQRHYFNGFSIEVPNSWTYEVDGDMVSFYEAYNYARSETGSNGFLFAIERTYNGPADYTNGRKLGSKDGMNFMLINPMGRGIIQDEYANQLMIAAIDKTDDVLGSFIME